MLIQGIFLHGRGVKSDYDHRACQTLAVGNMDKRGKKLFTGKANVWEKGWSPRHRYGHEAKKDKVRDPSAQGDAQNSLSNASSSGVKNKQVQKEG